MTRDNTKEAFEYQTCLCCMCHCGDHKCLQQMILKLPFSMQHDLEYVSKEPKTVAKTDCALQADLYRKTIYRRDYCEQPDIIDRVPLEQQRYVDNIPPNSKHGYALKDSLYKDDYIPWSRADQELCRGRLHIPDSILNRDAAEYGSGDVPTHMEEISERCYNYYCPTHCVGDKMEPVKENCLLGQKDHFNLGPPSKRTYEVTEKQTDPFAKYSNYMLDYKGHKIPPKRRPAYHDATISKSQLPMTSETSYRDAFTCPPEMPDKQSAKQKSKRPADALTKGDGPMLQHTTSMMDYKDPDVAAHQPVRPPRNVYQPPSCRMETTTTTGSEYPKWENFPIQEKPKKLKEEGFYKQHETDVRRLITIYQEDFGGVNSARCPCRVVEKYGPKVLEPCYNYTESNNLHDYFRFNKKDVEPGNQICPH